MWIIVIIVNLNRPCSKGFATAITNRTFLVATGPSNTKRVDNLTCSAPLRVSPSCQSGPSALPASVELEPWPRAFLSRNLHIKLETQLSKHSCLVKNVWETVIGKTSGATCCESLRFSRCHFLGSVAGSLAGKRFIWFVDPQRRDQELCCTGIEKGVSYGFILHRPDNLTSFHFIPEQTSEVYYNQVLWYMCIKHLVWGIFPPRGAKCLMSGEASQCSKYTNLRTLQ